MAHTKAQRAVKGNRDSKAKRLGIKKYGGQVVKAGNIVIRQQGTRFWPGEGTMLSNNFSIMATKEGVVTFYKKNGKTYIKIV